MSNQTHEPDENPMTSVKVNDVFVFMPSVATVVILLCMLYGLAAVSVQLVATVGVGLSGTVATVATLGLTVVYSGVALGLIYRDNAIELPLPSF